MEIMETNRCCAYVLILAKVGERCPAPNQPICLNRACNCYCVKIRNKSLECCPKCGRDIYVFGSDNDIVDFIVDLEVIRNEFKDVPPLFVSRDSAMCKRDPDNNGIEEEYAAIEIRPGDIKAQIGKFKKKYEKDLKLIKFRYGKRAVVRWGMVGHFLIG